MPQKKSNKKEYCKNIFLVGEIDDKMVKETLGNLIDDEDINKINTLNIFICSAGGGLLECFAIIDLIEYKQRDINYTINTFGLGDIASGGFFLFLLGDNRILFPRARVYVHEHVVTEDDGQAYTKRQETLQEDETLYRLYSSIVSKRLGISDKKAQTLLKKDKWLTDKEINDYNITTGAIV